MSRNASVHEIEMVPNTANDLVGIKSHLLSYPGRESSPVTISVVRPRSGILTEIQLER